MNIKNTFLMVGKPACLAIIFIMGSQHLFYVLKYSHDAMQTMVNQLH